MVQRAAVARVKVSPKALGSVGWVYTRGYTFPMTSTSPTTAARKLVVERLLTIGVVVPATNVQVKGGRVVKVYCSSIEDAKAAHALLGGTRLDRPGGEHVVRF